MPLTPGTRLGPYEIIAPLGAGGMGEVYRATDPRLGRDVAIKALPEEFAGNPERLARFEREARLLASLSHPNIAGIHGLEESAGNRYLVLEFVEGEDLATRLARGPLPPDDAIDVCRQVAAGVEAAHESGVVHRDLKPANVMLTPSGGVKVLDFGLAKGGAASTSASNLSSSPTSTHAVTGAGIILGTAAYMSPEQARGKTLDRRTDVWSFGCVLYECLTGRRAFAGETVSDMIARILEREPDWTAIPAATPPRVVQLLQRCLTKDATLRLRDIGEARIALAPAGGESGAEPASAAVGGRRSRRWIVVAAVAALAVATTALVMLAVQPTRSGGPVRRFRVSVPGLTQKFFMPLALTRDGRSLAYEADDRIWIRRLDRTDAVLVPGSEKGRSPFWSWDQSTLCFASEKKLWAFTPGGDQPREVCGIPESGEIVGGAWGAGDRIVLAVWRGGLYEVSAGGGSARLSVPIDSSIVDFHGPSFLPDGRTLLLYVHDRRQGGAAAVVEGNPPRLKRVYDLPGWASLSYSLSGHLLGTIESGAGGEVWALPFQLRSRQVTGPAFRVMAGATFANTSSDGLLVAYVAPPSPMGQLVWRRRGGADQPIGEPQQGLSNPSLSPDGGRIAFVTEQDGNRDVWVLDLARGTKTRISSAAEEELGPSWTPDGRRLLYTSSGGVGHVHIISVASDGSGAADTIGSGLEPVVSPDGRTLVYTVDRKGSGDIFMSPMSGGAERPFLATPATEHTPSFSPDGRWLAYASDESGRNEVYIRRFPEGDERAQVSVGGGTWPRWTRRGDGIYYSKHDTLMLVPVGAGPRPTLGLPRPLLETAAPEFELIASFLRGAPVDAHPDGVRFVTVRQVGPGQPASLLFVENWYEEFRRR